MVDRTDGLLYETGQGYSALDAQSARDRLDGYAVVSGLDVSPGGSLSVDVTAGEAIVGTDTNGDTITVSPGSTQNVSLAAADSANPRKDTIWIDDTGTAQVATGTAESALPEGNSRFNTFQPEPPFPGGDGTILAEVYVAAGASSLTSADIRDRRQPAQIVGEEIQTATADHELVITQEIAIDSTIRYVASDSELDDALAAANGGDMIILGNSTYTTGRTISDDLCFVGSHDQFGAVIDSSWTLDGSVKIQNVGIAGSGNTFTVNSDNTTIESCSGDPAVVVSANDFRYLNNLGGDVTFNAGTSGGIVDGCSGTAVTDNGTNTVGDVG